MLPTNSYLFSPLLLLLVPPGVSSLNSGFFTSISPVCKKKKNKTVFKRDIWIAFFRMYVFYLASIINFRLQEKIFMVSNCESLINFMWGGIPANIMTFQIKMTDWWPFLVLSHFFLSKIKILILQKKWELNSLSFCKNICI